MEVHVILGGVLFVAALVSVVVAAVMIVAALSPGRRSSNKIPERIFEVPSGGLSPNQGSLEAGQCYWDCLSGFHWAEDWEKRCSAACGLTEKPGVA
jgi:hypothetical protein